MNHQPIIERLSDMVPKLSGNVGGRRDFVLGMHDLPTNGHRAYVLPAADQAQASILSSGAVQQRVFTNFAVLLQFNNTLDSNEQNNQDEMTQLVEDVRLVLLGWAPSALLDPIQLVSGELVSIVEAVSWWQDIFKTSHLIRSV